jgi:ribonucleoside-triphosphate reductase
MVPNIISPSFLDLSTSPNWGPTGQEVYERTYQRVKSDGTPETWDDTVRRVVDGNVSLVPEKRILPGERDELFNLISSFKAIPGGRHLWMSGVEGRQFLFNCYVSGWGNRLSEHFTFTFNQLMEGGGVGSNYSDYLIADYKVRNRIFVTLICNPEHPNYRDLLDAGLVRENEFDNETASDAFLVDDSREGWVRGLGWIIDIAESDTYETEELDLVLDLSAIRAAGLPIKTFGGTSAGPVPYAKMIKEISHLLNEAHESGFNGPIAMEMDHIISECVVSGNVRRSARMSIMRWDDPWIDWFLKCKEDGLSHWSTNISVEIDEDFIEYVDRPSNDGDPIVDKARRVYAAVIEGMHRNGEPGLWNSSYANHGEPNKVISTNPCGEICLEGWENCNLGHINLSAFVMDNGSVDVDSLRNAHKLMARFLIRATFGDITDTKTRDVVSRNRRIGVGHFGFHAFLAKQGIKYSESHGVHFIRDLLRRLALTVEAETIKYAHELRIPVPVKSRTVAPTGTIAKLPGESESIQAIFAKYYIQRIRYSTVDPRQNDKIAEYRHLGYNVVPDTSTPNTMVVEIPVKHQLLEEIERRGIDPSVIEDASQISLGNSLAVQEMYQTLWADNAVSYTINFDPRLVSEDAIAKTLLPYLSTLKGTTMFPERGYELPPMERISEDVYNALRGNLADFYGDGVAESCLTGACPVR